MLFKLKHNQCDTRSVFVFLAITTL